MMRARSRKLLARLPAVLAAAKRETTGISAAGRARFPLEVTNDGH